MDTTAAVGLVSATALGLLANRVTERIVKSDQVLGGFPRWRWCLSAFTQAIVFPGIILLAWWQPSLSCQLDQWLRLPASQLSGFERWYIYALFASQSRDMIPKMPSAASMTMKVHHWVVVVASVLSLTAPAGFGLFIAGTFVLELGSMTFNLRTLYPGSQAINALYQVCMLTSNLVAVALGVFMLRVESIAWWMRALFFTADVGVCIGRQLHAMKDAGVLKSSKHSGGSAVEGLSTTGSRTAATASAAMARGKGRSAAIATTAGRRCRCIAWVPLFSVSGFAATRHFGHTTRGAPVSAKAPPDLNRPATGPPRVRGFAGAAAAAMLRRAP